MSRLVVDAVLQERLADALGQASVDLAFDDHRVHHVAEIVHGDEADDVDDTGLRVHLDFADVRPRRIGEVRRIVERLLREPRFEILQGVVLRHVGRERHLREGDGLVGVDDGEGPVGELHLVLFGLQHVRRDLLALGDDLVGGLDDGRAADGERSRAVGSERVVRSSGVAVQHGDVLERHAELVGDDLREGRLVALTVTVRAGDHRHRTGHVDADLTDFEQSHPGAERDRHLGRREPAGLDVAGEADAALLAGRFRSRPPGAEPTVVDVPQGLVEARLVVARVVGERHRRVVREVAGLDEVPPPDLARVDAHLPRRRLHATLHHVGRFRPAGATVGVHRRGVGVERLHFDVDGGRRVLPRHQSAVQIRRYG